MLPKAVTQVIATIVTHVPTWAAADFKPLVSKKDSKVCSANYQEATKIVQIPKIGRQLSAVKAKKLDTYLPTKLKKIQK